jgi:hypothetical protein
VVRGNLLRLPGPITLNASHWIWTGNTHVNGTLEVAAGARSNLIRDNVTASPITDKGTDTVLAGNVVMKKPAAPRNASPHEAPGMSVCARRGETEVLAKE